MSVEIVDLSAALDRTDLAPASRTELIDAFGPSFIEARDLVEKSAGITVTDATQVSEIKAARVARLAIRQVRIGAEKTRKDLKAESLKRGREIDNVAGMIDTLCSKEESRLQECEDFAARAEEKRRAEAKASRLILLAPYGVDTTFTDLGAMDEATFQRLLESSRLAHEARVAAEAKAEADRIEAARIKAEEDARIRAENERMRLEAIEAAKVAAAEKAKADAVLAAERKAAADREAALAEEARQERLRLQAVADAERQKREAAEAAQRAEAARLAAEAKAKADAVRKAAAAPDADKLKAFAAVVAALVVPECSTEPGRVAVQEIGGLITKLHGFILARAEKIAQ